MYNMIRSEHEVYGVNMLIKIPNTNWCKCIWGDCENAWFEIDKDNNILYVDFMKDPPREVLDLLM